VAGAEVSKRSLSLHPIACDESAPIALRQWPKSGRQRIQTRIKHLTSHLMAERVMEFNTINYRLVDQSAVIELSRPSRNNAWTGRMHSEYRSALQLAEQDPVVRVIVVTGDPAGKTFCPGADFAALEKNADNAQYDDGIRADIAKPGYGKTPHFDATFAYHFGLSKPVIAAINGAAAGVGLVLAAFADLRFAAAGAKFTTAHGRFNFPVEYGLSWILPRLVGVTQANDVLLSSRLFTAEEAMSMGFLNRVVPAEDLLPQVLDYAATLAQTASPGSVRESKRQIYSDLHRGVAAAVEDSEQTLRAMVKQVDAKEGVDAWMAKRPPNWRGNE